jgi:hypothetical protein
VLIKNKESPIGIMIKKRNGHKEVSDITKLQEMIIESTTGLDVVRQRKLELDAQIKFINGMSLSDIQDSLKIIKEEEQSNKEKQKVLYKQIIKNLGQIKLIKSQLINQIIYICNNSYFNIFLFNIIGINSSEKPNN